MRKQVQNRENSPNFHLLNDAHVRHTLSPLLYGGVGGQVSPALFNCSTFIHSASVCVTNVYLLLWWKREKERKGEKERGRVGEKGGRKTKKAFPKHVLCAWPQRLAMQARHQPAGSSQVRAAGPLQGATGAELSILGLREGS